MDSSASTSDDELKRTLLKLGITYPKHLSPEERADNAIIEIDKALEKKRATWQAEARMVELDLLEQFINTGQLLGDYNKLNAYKLKRLKALEAQLQKGKEEQNG